MNKHAEEFYSLGEEERKLGNYQTAITCYEQALSLQPDHFLSLLCLAVLYATSKRFEMAMVTIDRVLALQPDFEPALYNKGVIAFEWGKEEEAYAIFSSLAAAHPDNPEYLFCMGKALLNYGGTNEAIEVFRTLVKAYPEHPTYSLFLSAALQRTKDRKEAVAIARTLVQKHPDNPEFHHCLLQAQWKTIELAEAIQIGRALVDAYPEHPEYRHALCVAYANLGRNEQTLHLLQENLRKHPDHAPSRSLLGAILLLQGHYNEGFKENECRETLQLSSPRWRGENIEGKRLLVVSDGGEGDVIHFMRYVPLLSTRQYEVIVELAEDLQPLFSHLNIPFTVNRKGVSHDLHIGICSLPFIFQTDLSSIPPPIEISQAKKQPLSGRIGIVWKENPDFSYDLYRSIPLTLLEPLLQIQKIEWVALQKEIFPEEAKLLDTYGVKKPLLNGWLDTLHWTCSCETIITVDTSMAHFAGSLGVPTSVLLPLAPDWRWLLERKDSPWYPSITLYRQSRLNCWDDVIQAVAHDLLTHRF